MSAHHGTPAVRDVIRKAYKYPIDHMKEIWKRTIWHQFHDDVTGNCRMEPLPNSKLKVLNATSVDSGFFEKDFSSEGHGITPDVKIPLPFARKLTDNIDEWVLWVAEDLKKSPCASI